MKAIDLHIGSPVYYATYEAIKERHVTGVKLKDESVEITFDEHLPRHATAHKDDECMHLNSTATWYFDLESAEVEQLCQREAVVKQAYSNMIQCQERYQSLIAKYMLAGPSKPTCYESE